MNLIWRFLWVLFFSRFSSKITLFSENITSFRVLPTDIDVLMHMNNGRYLSLMDLGRIDFMIRCGVFPQLKKNKIYPVVASEMIRFRKSLSLFQRFDIVTKILGWDNKYFYLAQYFQVKQDIYAMALVKARFLRTGSPALQPSAILDLINIKNESPPLPEWIKTWYDADQKFYKYAIMD